MENYIGTKQKEVWKKHGIAERELTLQHFVKDNQRKVIKRNEVKDMNSLIIQMEDLGTVDKITLYFDDYRDERYHYIKELMNKIKVESALDDFLGSEMHLFNVEIYTVDDDTYMEAITSEKEIFIDETENLVHFICQKQCKING